MDQVLSPADRLFAGKNKDIYQNSGSSREPELNNFMIPYPGYGFGYSRYYDLRSLVSAMASEWDEGKDHVFRGIMSAFLKQYYPAAANRCMDAEEEYKADRSNSDKIYWDLLYRLNPQLNDFYWNDRRYHSLAALGEEMLTQLNRNDSSDESFWNELIFHKLLSGYARKRLRGLSDLTEDLDRLENEFLHAAPDLHRKRTLYYSLGYLLSGDRTLRVGEHCFDTPEELATHMEQQMQKSYSAFRQFSSKLIGMNNRLEPQFEAWLTVMGNADAVRSWKTEHSIDPEFQELPAYRGEE